MQENYQVPAVVRALDILEFLSDQKEATFTEIHASLGIPKSTAYHILSTLTSRGYVRFAGDSSKYSLGLRLVDLGTKSSSFIDIRAEALPLLRELVAKTNETCNLGILDGTEGIYIAKLEGRQFVRLNSWEGKRFSLHCTAMGKVLLAWQEEEKRAEMLPKLKLVRHTKNTITNLNKLSAHLRLVRKQGWGLDDQENEDHIRCLGHPVLSFDGRVLGAISISGLVTRFKGKYLQELNQELKSVARRLSENLGGSFGE
ncbi:MAG: IclR family transcriptional regulator [Deltaproteobacteria bacterium HGW-Deltaproteobacteria-21]|jgi:DNA-binding IclR family transcriptional regulator|nr:MAG: IclR family transcriptional regulator [Deltaproteobacteria bacterium HGW-Deltaproteobacteria-21]